MALVRRSRENNAVAREAATKEHRQRGAPTSAGNIVPVNVDHSVTSAGRRPTDEMATTVTAIDKGLLSIRNVRGLDEMPHLTSLNLHMNAIERIDGLDHLHGLTELNLSANNLISLANGLDSVRNSLRVLNVSCNRLHSLDGVQDLPNLERLQAAFNHIRALGPLSRLTPHHPLKYVDLACNAIADISELQHVAPLSRLREMRLRFPPSAAKPGNAGCPSDNPVVRVEGYLGAVQRLMPHLRVLDGTVLGVDVCDESAAMETTNAVVTSNNSSRDRIEPSHAHNATPPPQPVAHTRRQPSSPPSCATRETQVLVTSGHVACATDPLWCKTAATQTEITADELFRWQTSNCEVGKLKEQIARLILEHDSERTRVVTEMRRAAESSNTALAAAEQARDAADAQKRESESNTALLREALRSSHCQVAALKAELERRRLDEPSYVEALRVAQATFRSQEHMLQTRLGELESTLCECKDGAASLQKERDQLESTLKKSERSVAQLSVQQSNLQRTVLEETEASARSTIVLQWGETVATVGFDMHQKSREVHQRAALQLRETVALLTFDLEFAASCRTPVVEKNDRSAQCSVERSSRGVMADDGLLDVASRMDAEAADLRSRLAALEGHIASQESVANQSAEALDAERAGMRRTVANLQSTIALKDSELADLEQQFRDKLDEKRDRIQQMQQVIDSLRDATEPLHVRVSQADTELQRLRVEKSQMESSAQHRLAEARKLHAALSATNLALRDTLLQQERRCEQLLQETRHSESNLVSVRVQFEAECKARQVSDAALKSCQSRLTILEAHIASAARELHTA